MLRSRCGVVLLKLLCLVVLSATSSTHKKVVKGVTYDGRSLIINRQRDLLFSGSIHYPRSTPETWPQIIAKAKHGGLNVIQTYVFWNVHEPVQGQFNFAGRNDLVKFIKTVWKQGLYVTLRIGPFIEAEWNFGIMESLVKHQDVQAKLMEEIARVVGDGREDIEEEDLQWM